MKVPAISILLSVNTEGQFLTETIRSIQEQTFEDFEVACVDNSSSECTADLLAHTAEQDSRFTRLRAEMTTGGKSAQKGVFSAAKGEYVIFLENGDLLDPRMLETLYDEVAASRADIAICDLGRIKANGRETQQKALRKQWLPETTGRLFSYRDCPDCIMRVADPVPGNKLYRRDFLREAQLQFKEGSLTNDISFVPVSIAAAQKIVYIPQLLVRFLHIGGLREWRKLEDIQAAVLAAAKQAYALPYHADIENAILSFVADSFLLSMAQYIKDFSAPDAAKFYQASHECFNKIEFANFSQESFRSLSRYLEFCTVKKHDYETMKRMVNRRLIVSLTSYPRRIGTVAKALETIYAQTRKADEVVLWLAEEQFPGKEADLPQDLVQLIDQKRLAVRWCENLMPHKKYFYALQEYRDDLVVTIDDDLMYSKDTLAALYKSYLLYPDAVSAVRAHLILVSERNQVMPYDTWPKEIDICIHEPCMQLMATGGAGTLYPPNLYRTDFFDREVIQKICPLADDLWLKAMQLLSDVPVVLARPFEPLCYLPGTQEEALRQMNVSQNRNDVQLAKITEWLDERFSPDIFVRKLTEPNLGTDIHGMETVTYYLDKDRRVSRSKRLTAERKLKEAECTLQQIKDRLNQTEYRLQQTEAERKQTESKWKQAEEKQNRTETELKQAQDRLQRAEESMPIKHQLKDLGKYLRDLKLQGHCSISWWFKYLLYMLAWIPEMILTGLMFFLQNGLKRTIEHVSNKLFGHRN